MFKKIERNNYISSVAKSSLAFALCSFFQKGISILTTPIFTRLLTTEQYGYYTIFVSWTEIVSVFATLRLSGSVFMQALVKYEDDRKKLASSVALLGTILTIAFFVIYLIFQRDINYLLGVPTLIVCCMFLSAWATLMFELWADCQRCDYKYYALIIFTIIISIVKPALGIMAVLSTKQFKAEYRIISMVTVEVLAYGWLFPYFLIKGRGIKIRKYCIYMLRLNIPLIPHYLTRIMLNQCDRLMINYMVGYSAAGVYSLGHSLAWMLTLISTSILNSFNPWIFKRLRNGKLNGIANVSNILLMIVAFFGIGIVTFAPEIVRLFAPINYTMTIWVIPPLCVSVYFMFMYSLFAAFEYYYEKTQLLAASSVCGGLLNVLLNYIFIKKYGFIAAGYTTMFCYVLYALVHYICMTCIVRNEFRGERIFNMKQIVLLSSIYIIISFGLMAFYDLPICRYVFFVLILVVCMLFKNKIFKVINAIKD